MIDPKPKLIAALGNAQEYLDLAICVQDGGNPRDGRPGDLPQTAARGTFWRALRGNVVEWADRYQEAGKEGAEAARGR